MSSFHVEVSMRAAPYLLEDQLAVAVRGALLFVVEMEQEGDSGPREKPSRHDAEGLRALINHKLRSN